jgi:hypothetical protein
MSRCKGERMEQALQQPTAEECLPFICSLPALSCTPGRPPHTLQRRWCVPLPSPAW